LLPSRHDRVVFHKLSDWVKRELISDPRCDFVQWQVDKPDGPPVAREGWFIGTSSVVTDMEGR
ncbi:MAG: hypothetical protein IMZ71_01885, partial [Chloroflexi bacterium]|nr:hypothetical protein [Chloroflexota bacterium]